MSYIDSTMDSPLSQLADLNEEHLESPEDEAAEQEAQRQAKARPDAGSIKARLVEQIDDINLARYLEDDHLDEIGMQAVREFTIDKVSREDWMTRCEQAMRYAMQVQQEKSFPWPRASNVIFPIIAQAALEFHARAYPAIIQGRRVVKGVVWGSDKGTPATTDGKPPADDGSNIQKNPQSGQPQWLLAPGEKRERADRISEHMSWQLLEEMPEWEPQTDQALLQAPIVGGFVRKTFFDPVEKRNKSLVVSLANLVWNYHATTFEACPRHSEIIAYYPNEIAELERAGAEGDPDDPESVTEGTWLHYDYAAGGGGEGMQYGWDPEWQAGQQDDESAPHLFIEQNRWIDLDDDGYAEPYTVTVHLRSQKVVRIVARYDDQGISARDDNFITCIKPLDVYTLYPFLPNMEGGSYPMGFGHLLTGMNAAINTSLNQMFDAGTLQNAGGGFISDQLGMPSGQTLFQVGKFVRVNTKGGSIREAVYPMDFKGPSPTLFQLLGVLMESSKGIAGISDVLTGDAAMANAPPTTVLALIEQGMKGYTSIHKRIFNAEKSELDKLYALNRKHMKDKARYRIGDEWREITPDDYRLGGGVEPIADPTMTTDAQKMGRASLLLSFAGDPTMNGQEIKRRVLEAANIERIDELFVPPNPMQAQMAQMAMAMQQAELGKTRAEELKNQTQAFLNMALARKNATAQEEVQINAQLTYLRLSIEAINAQTRADAARHASINSAMDHAQRIDDRVTGHHMDRLRLAHDAAQSALDRQATADPTPAPAGPFPLADAPPPGPAIAKPTPGGPPADLGGGMQSLGPASAGDMGQLPGRAAGGPLEPGQPTVVGEHGPEVVVSQLGGTVLPNQAGNAAAAAGGPTPPGRQRKPGTPPDMSATYNTPLDPTEEAQFQAWAHATGRQHDVYDYDLRGAWKADAKAAGNGHLPDTWKKPNHPTFSDESQYSGRDNYKGGSWKQGADKRWSYRPSGTNLQMYGADGLRKYFGQTEPDSTLDLPGEDTE